jgi:hypothetical protein
VAAAGADGADGAIPIVTCAVPVSVAPLPNVVTAVIVNCVGEIAIVGVPEIVPVAVSKVKPAGRVPCTEKDVLTAPVAVIAEVIGVIALPTVALAVVTDAVTSIGVVNVETEVVDAPDPAELTATTVTEYSVPGESPETATDEPIAVESAEAVPIDPDDTGETVTVYESIVAPPVNVAAPIVILAVVVDVAAPETDAGAPGTCGETPNVNVAVPVEVAPPATVVEAVTVKVVSAIALVGVPVISPVVVLRVSPAGSGPVTEYEVLVGDAAEIDVEIGVIALPTVALSEATDVVTVSGVVNVVVVEVVPAPLLLVAVVVTEYVVPGARLLGVIVVVVDVSVIAVPPPSGVSVAEYPVIDAPPVDVGAVTTIDAAVADVAVAEVIEGAEGGAAGVVIVDDAAVVAPSPTALVARVVIVYVVPGVNPVSETAFAISAAVTVNLIGVPPPAGVAMISYSVIVDPPLLVAAPIFIVAVVAVAADAVTVAGAPGTVAGVTAAEATEAADPPLMLFATTL